MFIEKINSVKEIVTQSIKKAAQSTGVDFGYLMKTAQRESGVNLAPNAKAQSTSATGTFQFIESTWLQMVKQHGKEAGLGHYAKTISQNASGQYTVNPPHLKEEILNLRTDPETSSFLAAKLTQNNAESLFASIGRAPTSGELYMAHFMGAGGAAKLINAMETNPNARATDLFPKESAANPTIFSENGKFRSISDVYAELSRSHNGIKSNTIMTGTLDHKDGVNSPKNLYSGLNNPNAPMFHTMIVTGNADNGQKANFATIYLPNLMSENTDKFQGNFNSVQASQRAYGYQKNIASASANRFFSNLLQPVSVNKSLDIQQFS